MSITIHGHRGNCRACRHNLSLHPLEPTRDVQKAALAALPPGPLKPTRHPPRKHGACGVCPCPRFVP